MNSLKILLVEDQYITAADIQETLEKAGHRITAIARNFEEAMTAVGKNTPDLAIIDITLTGSSADGIITARELLKRHWMPLIYLTANSELPTFQRAKETQPAAYLLKPFRHHELAFQVELAYLNQGGSRQSANPFSSDSLYLPINKGHDKINKQDVIYLQASGAYVKVFMMGDTKPQLLTMNLGYLAQYFSTPDFLRLSRSLLVNLNHISRLESSQIFLNNNTISLLIPEGSRASLLQKLAVVKAR